eukprot:CAMPEP_0204028764 /NCGR_PEP_ID=MMETSP0360-20130528/53069_1 /ASSEMBLY_ACC=CAM_ASM_000342 /TAXON_ID=268821 /ORGANISM="Scrippsiella Hangoei, Strain SHTV-5" /LENGTH=141 /DNA_ID=CAMNT_0050972637 /DNA_START=394 /DNA_END=819 /DNA_ORIENTATION=-
MTSTALAVMKFLDVTRFITGISCRLGGPPPPRKRLSFKCVGLSWSGLVILTSLREGTELLLANFFMNFVASLAYEPIGLPNAACVRSWTDFIVASPLMLLSTGCDVPGWWKVEAVGGMLPGIFDLVMGGFTTTTGFGGIML